MCCQSAVVRVYKNRTTIFAGECNSLGRFEQYGEAELFRIKGLRSLNVFCG